MIATTLGALVLADSALAEIKALRLPVAPAYHVAKLARLVAVEVEAFHTHRNAIIDDLGVERPATDEERFARGGAATVKQVPPERLSEFRDRLETLAAIPVTIPTEPIALVWLTADGLAVRPQTLLDLGPLLDEPEGG